MRSVIILFVILVCQGEILGNSFGKDYCQESLI